MVCTDGPRKYLCFSMQISIVSWLKSVYHHVYVTENSLQEL
jgi:hypothetical protein